MIPFIQWFVIINPTSGNGSSIRKWPRIKSLLASYEFQYKYAFTQHAGHSIDLVQLAINQGIKNIICIGGDGTIHNVVNGIMIQEVVTSSKIRLAVIPIGTGNDWVKTYGIPKDIEHAIQLIKNAKLKQQDVGKIEFINKKLRPVFFNNLVGIGFDGFVVSKVDKYKSFGKFAYLIGATIGLFGFKSFKTTISFNSHNISANAFMVLVGLCQFSGGGMQLTKDPDPNDGFFDISIAQDFRKLDVLKNIVKLFNGKITYSPKIITAKAKTVTVVIEGNEHPLIQADGELLGSSNFKASILPEALSFYG